ncbi:ABC transporter ATP-binding protein [Virgisporangium aliadipatigenens]|uniref:ABC transporter ATP-binding protein n=1 Tax=Virgisporangium aliadipatigenens TaxID=741659 RepID=A0A8J4DXB5_9ACTN|nr:ABC transporter ATP-binding protein [Virgisporangium aliadipatigenens]GIJ51927.1 ABC transporter ATP-binding protein [Virgisporangium aliadipatigenens]
MSEMQKDGAAVSLSGLRKRYGDVRAVDGVDLTVAPGEVVALLGPNGAGKSTTVDMILGLTRPDEGTARVFGRSPEEAIRSGAIGAMLQSGALRDNATVAETVGIMAALHGRPGRTRAVLEQVGLTDIANTRTNKLSGGQKQRVRFALALVSEPDLLILDEPTVAMDVSIRRDFWRAMRDYTSAGRTVIFATHYLEEAESYADRVVLMRSGRVVADGTVAQVRAAASGRTLRAVVPGVGTDELERLPGVTGADVRAGRVVLSCADSDATVRALLSRYPDAADIEITAVNLEDAFLTLTAEPALAGGEAR